jgi:hypothetical protein
MLFYILYVILYLYDKRQFINIDLSRTMYQNLYIAYNKTRINEVRERELLIMIDLFHLRILVITH